MKFTDKYFYTAKLYVVYDIAINNIFQLLIVEDGPYDFFFFCPYPVIIVIREYRISLCRIPYA